jgi:hypothetical protein
MSPNGSGPLPRNLVIVRAGDRSLHGAWLEGARAGHYDLIVSYFGSDPDRYRTPEEHRVDYRGGKWDGIYAVFAADPGLLDRYDYFWLPDDDIEANSGSVAEMFRLMAQHDLAIAQPALTHDSYFSILLCLQCPSFRLRYADVIEIMVPCLRRDLLRIVLPLFRDTRSGFGLDFIWTRLLPDNARKAAILDCVTVRHTRPVGGELHGKMAKSGESAVEEMKRMMSRFHIEQPRYMVYAGLTSGGAMVVSRWRLAFRMGADYFRARHRAVEPRLLIRAFRIVRRHLLHRANVTPLPIPPDLQADLASGLPSTK